MSRLDFGFIKLITITNSCVIITLIFGFSSFANNQLPTTKQIDSLLELSEKAFMSDAENDRKYSEKALQLATKINDTERIIKANLALGKIIQFTSPTEAVIYFKKATKLAEKQKNLVLLSHCYRITAVYYLKWRQYNYAYDYIQKEIKLISDNNLDRNLPYSVVANIYKEQGNYSEAISYFEKAIGNYKQSIIRDEEDLASLYSDLGNVYYASKKYKKAIEYYKKGIEEAKKMNSSRHLGFLMDNMGLALTEMKQLEEAKKWQTEALFHREKVGSELGIMVGLNNLGNTYLSLGELDSALFFAKRSYALDFTELFLRKEVTELLANIYAKKEMYEEAYKYFGESMKWQQQMTIQINNLSIKNVVSSFEVKQAKLKLDFVEAKNNAFVWIGVAMIVVIISTIVLLFVLNYQHKKRKKLLEREAKLNITKDKLFSVISHDLQAPISSLQSLLMLNQIKKQSQEILEQRMGKIGKQIDNVNLLLKNLLLWSNNQLNGLKTSPITLDLAEAAQSQIDALEGVAHQKNISVINKIDANSQAYCDRDQYELIIRNLISNALKYTPEGGKIEVEEKRGNSNITIFIKDNGVGMDKITVQELVQSEAQNSSKRGTNGEVGTGIGLSLVKEMIKYNQGKFWIESELGKGSVFSFSLPVA